MAKRRCFVADVGNAIERLADELDPERKPPFSGDILDLLEWAARDMQAMRAEIRGWHHDDVAELRQQLTAATDQIAAAVAACKIKDDALDACREWLRCDYFGQASARSKAEVAIAITPSISEWNTRWQKENDELRQQLTECDAEIGTAWAQAHRLALELDCLIMDTKDNAVVSKWWDSAFGAMEEYHKLRPGAAEGAEAWAKMRKVGI